MTKDEFTPVAQRVLILHDRAAGKSGEIRIAIGQPYWIEQHVEAACPVAIDGCFGRLADIRGIDPISALSLALKFIDELLKGLPETQTLSWPDGEPYFEV